MGRIRRFFQWACACGRRSLEFLGLRAGYDYLDMIALPKFENPEDDLHLHLYVLSKYLNDESVDIDGYFWSREFILGRRLKRVERSKMRKNRSRLDFLKHWSRLWES